MLLETLDTSENNVLIYSQNKFDFESNFKIIFKNEAIKRPKTISFFEVCEFIKEPEPKNLLIYRLLTNVNKLDSYSTKYGFFVRINKEMELVYLDPIYALKDIKYLNFDFDPGKFRFKIQQIGLTFSSVDGGEASYTEKFAFELKAAEAQHQNDKIYAQAIFALDDSFIDDEGPQREAVDSIDMRIVEEVDSKQKSLDKPDVISDSNTRGIRDKKIEMVKNALGIESGTKSIKFSEFISKHRSRETSDIIPAESVIDLFKSSQPLQKKEEGESVVLRLTGF